jgi:hypothetical protein
MIATELLTMTLMNPDFLGVTCEAHLFLLLYNILQHYLWNIWAKVALVYNASTKAKCHPSPKHHILFESDSFPIMVDNGASYSISNDLKDFVMPPTKIGPKIQGFAGSYTTSLIGAVKWHIQCDDGIVHTIILPNTSYVPQAEVWMLSPQHWAQATNDHINDFITPPTKIGPKILGFAGSYTFSLIGTVKWHINVMMALNAFPHPNWLTLAAW